MGPWLSDRLLSSQSDERLVALARAGSDRAFAAIVQRYRGPLHAFAQRLDANGDAEDLVQQTFLSALAAMRSGAEVRHLRGWLHQILRHAAIQSSKRVTRSAELESADLGTPSAQHEAELRMLAAEALAALAKLPDRQHEALVATAVQGLSRAEVARLLGVTEGAVRQLVHRARETVRSAVTAITPYPLAQAFAAGPSGGGLADGVASAGAGSAGALAAKLGALVASGVVATGIVASGIHTRSQSTHRGLKHRPAAAAPGSAPASHGAGVIRLAATQNGVPTRVGGGGIADSRSDGVGATQSGSDGGPGTGSDGSPGGPSPGSGSSDGGSNNSSSPGGPTATMATSTGDGGGSGSSDGGQTTTTTTTTTSGSPDGGTSGGSGSGGSTTTTSSSGH